MKRPLLVAVLLVPVVAPASATGGNAAGPPTFPPEARGTAALMLRLVDVPGGFTIGDDTGCGGGVENAPPALAEALIVHLPWMCSIEFEHWRWDPYIESFAFGFRTVEGATALFALRQDLFRYWGTGIEQITERPEAGVGEEARLFLVPDAYVPGSNKGRDAAVVFWRRGAVLAAVEVAGRSQSRVLRLARRLARRQDRRMRKPAPIRPHENDDLEVPLADPRIGAPVQWLGRRLASRDGLPTLQLAYTNGPERPEPDERLPTPRARLEYEIRRPRSTGVELVIWRPAQWRRISHGVEGPQLWRSPCARTRRIGLRAGHAVVYAGYARLLRGGRCPSWPRDSFAALAVFRRVVVAVNMPYCDRCAEGETGKRAPYNSVQGMTAVVRALRRLDDPGRR
jgi:hypothetical protein